jgi:hypothetical protein
MGKKISYVYNGNLKIGDKSGYLEITGFNKNTTSYSQYRWEVICICHKCGREDVRILTHNFKRYKTCNCDYIWKGKDAPFGEANPLFKGYKDIPCNVLYKIKTRAEQKGLEVEITNEFMWDLFIKQNKKCILSGLPIQFGSHHKNIEMTASLDRIDSSKGYTKDNVQWVHKDVNWMKHKMSEERLYELCELVLETRNINKIKNITLTY